MTVAITIVEPRVELVFEDDEASLASAIDADTVLGRVPGSVGLDVLESTTQAEAQAAIGVTSSSGVVSIISGRVGAHETAPNPHRQYIGQYQAVLSAAFFGA